MDMLIPKPLFRASLAGLAAACLFLQPSPAPSNRGIASCVDPTVNVLPFPELIFGKVQDEALRNSAMQFYLLLSQVEANALSGRQAIRSSYGIIDSPSVGASLYAPPSVVNFISAANPFGATGHLWGNINALNSVAKTTGINGGITSVPSTLGLPLLRAPANGATLTGLRPPPASLTRPGVPSNIPSLSMTSIGGAAAP